MRLLLFSMMVGLALSVPTKFEPRLAKSLLSKNLVNIFVKFGNGNADVIENLKALQFFTRLEKSRYLIDALKQECESSQRNAIQLLQSPRFAYFAIKTKQFWISNELYVQAASLTVVKELELLPEVTEIREEVVISLEEVRVENITLTWNQWNLQRIQAYEAWDYRGNGGLGAVVASIDTGVRWTHEAVQEQYRNDGYGWYDPISLTEFPEDPHGSGTFMMGIAVGKGVGVAPNAQWIACKGCDPSGRCFESELKMCGEWILAPTDRHGFPDPAKAPHVVFNSWGSLEHNSFYSAVLHVWEASSIISIFPAVGNGPNCGTVGSPADDALTIGVGATDHDDTPMEKSGRGPSFRNIIKPDISAPGRFIRSSWGWSNYAYITFSGTSFATAHVAGVAALMRAANPSLPYHEAKAILLGETDTDLPQLDGRCENSNMFPNNHYGHGMVNALKVVGKAVTITKRSK